MIALIVAYVVVSILIGALAATDAGFITYGEAAEAFVMVAIGWPLFLVLIIMCGLCQAAVAVARKAGR